MLWRTLFCLALTCTPALAASRVVASIKPVHALVAGVMHGVGVPDLIVSGAASIHTYSLRPSEARMLANDAIVFWIGPTFENFLDKPLATLGDKAKAVALINAPGVHLRAAREGGLWEPHAEEHAAHSVEETDGHIWLDPGNAKAMVAEIARVLSEADPANDARYAANAENLTARIDGLDGELKTQLAPVREKPFVVFHDAYQYFERHFGVTAVGSITVAADRPPGAKRIAAIREKILAHGARCVFAEPQFEPKLVQTLIAGTDARSGTLDPEGSTLSAGEDTYFALMRGLAGGLTGCLSR